MDEKSQKILRMRPGALRARPKQPQLQEKSRRKAPLSLERSGSGGKVIPFKPRPETDPPEPAA